MSHTVSHMSRALDDVYISVLDFFVSRGPPLFHCCSTQTFLLFMAYMNESHCLTWVERLMAFTFLSSTYLPHVDLSCLNAVTQEKNCHSRHISVIHGVYEWVTTTHVRRALDVSFIDLFVSCGPQLSDFCSTKTFQSSMAYMNESQRLMWVKRLMMCIFLSSTVSSHVDLSCLNANM